MKPLPSVVYYWMLNKVTKKNKTLTPQSEGTFDIIGGSKSFMKIGLKTIFHQVRVKLDDTEKIALQIKYGQNEYLVMSMGLSNAPATFTTMMNEFFKDYIDQFCTVYLDDTLIFSKTVQDDYRHVAQVLKRS